MALESLLECGHEEAMDVPRELRNTVAIEVTGHLSDGVLHEVRDIATVGGEGMSSPASTFPDAVRGGSHVGPYASPETIHVPIPPKRNFRTAHAAPTVYQKRALMTG